MVTEFYPPLKGGLEFHVEGLANELAARGHSVHVATLGPERTDTARGDVLVHQIPSVASRLKFLYTDPDRPFHPPVSDPLVRRHLRQIVREFRPDVVHGHNWMSSSFPPGLAPLVLTSHDYAWVCPKRTLMRPDGSTCSGPTLSGCTPCGASQYGAVKAFFVDAATRRAHSVMRPDVLVAVSNAVATSLAPHTARKPVVVPNFVPSDLSSMPDVAVDGLPDEPFALFAGSTGAHKGIEVVLRAWEQCAPPLPLVVAGLGTADRHWPKAVTFMSLSHSQLISVLRHAAVAVVPSLWPEPCPTVVLEAMSLGVPVVASRVGGVPDLLSDGVEGRLVPPGDPALLMDAVVQIVTNTSLRQKMGAAGRARADAFQLNVVVEAIEAVYRDAMELYCARSGRYA